MDFVVSIPDPVAHQCGDTHHAIERYRAGRLSHRQVGEALGLDYWQTEIFLKERGVALNYSATDLEADAGTLEKILLPMSSLTPDRRATHHVQRQGNK